MFKLCTFCKFCHYIYKSHIVYLSGWPSGLRRQTQGSNLASQYGVEEGILVLSEGRGSNPLSDKLFLSLSLCVPDSRKLLEVASFVFEGAHEKCRKRGFQARTKLNCYTVIGISYFLYNYKVYTDILYTDILSTYILYTDIFYTDILYTYIL